MFSRIEEPPPDTMAPPATPLEEDQTRWEHLGIVALESDKEVDARYERVAEEVDDDFFSDAAKLPSRTPYLRGARMGRGAAFYNTFRQFTERGGLGHFKNAVVMNVRMNSISNLNMIEESFECEFFLDMAYWVPRFDREHHENEATLGKFAKYEPVVDFPEFLEHTWVSRSTEFSQDAHARKHETQLGQNAETQVKNVRRKKPKGLAGDTKFAVPPRSLQVWKKGDGLDEKALDAERKKRNSARQAKTVVRVGDACSHWPRLWRVMVSDAELEEMRRWRANDESEEERKLAKAREPTNEKPTNLHPRLKTVFKFLDEKRRRDLSHPEEGIVFCSIDIACKVRQSYSLQDFPYDFQELVLTVRLDKDHADPLIRYIVPVAHDKAFFCSSRVPELTEWDVTKNLDWSVERGLQGDATRDGGKQRLIVKVITKRKHFYYTTHFVGIIFSMTTCVFSSFTLDAHDQIEARTGVIFNLLLTVVAFNYCCADSVPKTPYATTLDAFINANFIIIMVVGMVIFLFSYFAYIDVRNGHVHWVNNDDDTDENAVGYPRYTAGDNLYSRDVETAVGISLTGLWIVGNMYFWSRVAERVMRTTAEIQQDEQLGWLTYRKRAIPVCERQLRNKGTAS